MSHRHPDTGRFEMNTRPVAVPIAPMAEIARESPLILPRWGVDGDPAEARHQEDGPAVATSRRAVLRLGLAAVLGGASALEATGALAATRSPQGNWRWCNNCSGLWFNGDAAGSNICPAGGPHPFYPDYNYLLRYGSKTPAGHQGNWRYCNKCRGLWFAGGAGTSSCPAGGRHSSQGSRNYRLRYGAPPASGNWDDDWHSCTKCKGLFWLFGDAGQCPAGGEHSPGGREYKLSFTYE